MGLCDDCTRYFYEYNYPHTPDYPNCKVLDGDPHIVKELEPDEDEVERLEVLFPDVEDCPYYEQAHEPDQPILGEG